MVEVIDADGAVVGRLASKTAKKALEGEEVRVVNSKKAIFTGNREKIIEKWKNRRAVGDPHQGPFYPKRPDKILKRTVRGMLPMDKKTGREAFKRVKTYLSTPEMFEGKAEKFEKRKKDLKHPKYITLEELSKHI